MPGRRGVVVDVRLEQGTVWLTQRQMAELLETTPPGVCAFDSRRLIDYVNTSLVATRSISVGSMNMD
ncbi:MAG: hypothetical protein AB2L09_04450 [Coriobacteriia bacterium]